ncbi:MAG: LysR family transcriptional regulator [Chloroflexi bacterium]|nr:LysR family transcriptional regulator [Chloroflexota bacterium]
MNTNRLRLFITSSRHRSLARAALELGLEQTTVSERLKALETEVGTPLFEGQRRAWPSPRRARPLARMPSGRWKFFGRGTNRRAEVSARRRGASSASPRRQRQITAILRWGGLRRPDARFRRR